MVQVFIFKNTDKTTICDAIFFLIKKKKKKLKQKNNKMEINVYKSQKVMGKQRDVKRSFEGQEIDWSRDRIIE